MASPANRLGCREQYKRHIKIKVLLDRFTGRFISITEICLGSGQSSNSLANSHTQVYNSP